MTTQKTHNGLTYSINYLGFNNRDQWQHFQWSIVINGQDFTYKTGIGHATPIYKNKPLEYCYALPKNKKPDNSLIDGALYVHIPSINEVLECLTLDAQFGAMSFYDFCDVFGYDRDSIKALEIHLQCQKTRDKMKAAKIPLDLQEKSA